MFKKIGGINFVALIFCLYLIGQSELPLRYKEWLDLVRPIITSLEKEVFLQLKTDQERDKFITFFWKQRDPRPDTRENEFYQEYMARIEQADRLFSPGPTIRGSLTERGYYYLLLGPPLERQLFTTHSELWPAELWFYRGDERYGLPPFFYLIFYQPQGQGDYRLYYPGIEGPEKLLVPSLNRQLFNREAAYNLLKKISPELANASLSFVPGTDLASATSLSSETLLASIRSLPERKFNEAYARHFINYQGIVEVDYADRYVESNFRAAVFIHQGQPFLHWALEPEIMSFTEENGQAYAIYELFIKIEDKKQRIIWEKNEEIPVRLTKEEFEAQGRRIFSFQDLFPIIPGQFNLHFLLKNKTVKEFTSSSIEIEVPKPKAKFGLSQPLIYFLREERPKSQQSLFQAFSFGQWLYRLNARSEIPAGAKIGLLIQFWPSADKGEKPSLLSFSIKRATDNEVVKTWEKDINSLEITENVLDTGYMAIDGLKPDYYYLDISLFSSDRKLLASRREGMILLEKAYPPIPRILSRLHPAYPDLESFRILASQYFLSGQYEEALRLTQQILNLKEDTESRLLLGKSLFALQRYSESINVLQPLYEVNKIREAGKVIALDLFHLKKWKEALNYLENMLQEATELSLLNLAAECYLNLGLSEKALTLIERSLQLEPNQPEMAKLKEMIKAKIK